MLLKYVRCGECGNVKPSVFRLVGGESRRGRRLCVQINPRHHLGLSVAAVDLAQQGDPVEELFECFFELKG